MLRHMSVVTVGAVLTVVLTGCSSPDLVSSARQQSFSDPASPVASAEEEEALAGTSPPPINTREQVLPWLKKAYGKVTWPSTYNTLTSEGIYTRFMEPATDVQFFERDAIFLVNFWNLCAWALQLIDDTKESKPVNQDVASLTKLSKVDLKQFVDPMVKEAKLGRITFATEFAVANDCYKGFTPGPEHQIPS